MEELKPCPFCGGKAYIYYHENSSIYRSNIFRATYRAHISCDRCKATLGVRSTARRAIEAWNRRVDCLTKKMLSKHGTKENILKKIKSTLTIILNFER